MCVNKVVAISICKVSVLYVVELILNLLLVGRAQVVDNMKPVSVIGQLSRQAGVPVCGVRRANKGNTVTFVVTCNANSHDYRITEIRVDKG